MGGRSPLNFDPLVSVVTPSYNQGRFIEDTLRSVAGQDFPRTEHLVVDGDSTDDTLTILRDYEDRYNLRWISEPDRGQSHALNKGFGRVEGDVVGWLNADDVYLHREVFRNVVRTFREHPDADVLYSHFGKIDAGGRLFGVRASPRFSRERLRRVSYLPQCTAFFRREVLEDHPLDESMVYTMDTDLFLRIARTRTIRRTDDIHACFRYHADSLTKRTDEPLEGAFHAELRRLRQKHPPTGGIRGWLARTADRVGSLALRARGWWMYQGLLRGRGGYPEPFPFIELPV